MSFSPFVWAVILQGGEWHCCLPESLQWLQRGREPAILHGLSVLCLHVLQAGQWIDRVRCQHPQHLQRLDLWCCWKWWGSALAVILHCCNVLWYFIFAPTICLLLFYAQLWEWDCEWVLLLTWMLLSCTLASCGCRRSLFMYHAKVLCKYQNVRQSVPIPILDELGWQNCITICSRKQLKILQNVMSWPVACIAGRFWLFINFVLCLSEFPGQTTANPNIMTGESFLDQIV